MPRRVEGEQDAVLADGAPDHVGRGHDDAHPGGRHPHGRRGVLGAQHRVRGEADLAAGPVEDEDPVDQRLHRAADPVAVGELGEADGAAPREGVVEGDDDDQLLPAQAQQRPGPPGGFRSHREVGDAPFQLLLQGLGGAVLAQDQGHPGMQGPPAGDDAGEQPDGHGVQGGEVQFASGHPGSGAGGPFGLVGAAYGELGVREEGAAHGGEPDPARHPLQEGAAHGPFQGLDLVGEGGLGDVQGVRGPGEGGFLHDGEEVLHLAQAHGPEA